VVIGTFFKEFGTLFADINHYSRLDALIAAAKRLYENFGEKEYAVALVRLMLYDSIDFIALTETSDQYLERVLEIAKKAEIDIEEPRIK
jgi:hypothetical protein